MTAALQIPYCFSFVRRGSKSSSFKDADGNPIVDPAAAAAAAAPKKDAVGYESSIKTISIVGTVEEFWQTYDYLKRPNSLPAVTDLHIFRNGIKPTWEDSANAKGGKWIVRMPKGLASRYWEEIIFCIIGGQFTGIPDGEICGAVLSIRFNEDILALWNKSAHDREIVDRIRDCIKKVLQLPPYANMEYKPHQTSIADRSSFRNTQVWKPKSLDGRSASQGPGGLDGAISAASAAVTASRPRKGSWTERELDGPATTPGGLKPKREGSRGWR